MDLYSIQPQGIGFYHSALFSGDSSRLLHVSIACSFLLLSNIPWYRYTTICLTIHLLKNSWVASSLGLLQAKLLPFFLYRILCEHIGLHLSRINAQEGIVGLSCSFMFSFWRSAKLFSRVDVSFYIPTTAMYERSVFSASLPEFDVIINFVILAILMGV